MSYRVAFGLRTEKTVKMKFRLSTSYG